MIGFLNQASPLQNTIIPNRNRACDLVVRRTYGQEAAMRQSLTYQINVLSAKFSFCPNVSVLMCLCVDQASYLADSEMWVSGFHVAGPATKGPTLQRPPALLKQQTEDFPQQKSETCRQTWTSGADPKQWVRGILLSQPVRRAERDCGKMASWRLQVPRILCKTARLHEWTRPFLQSSRL